MDMFVFVNLFVLLLVYREKKERWKSHLGLYASKFFCALFFLLIQLFYTRFVQDIEIRFRVKNMMTTFNSSKDVLGRGKGKKKDKNIRKRENGKEYTK